MIHGLMLGPNRHRDNRQHDIQIWIRCSLRLDLMGFSIYSHRLIRSIQTSSSNIRCRAIRIPILCNDRAFPQCRGLADTPLTRMYRGMSPCFKSCRFLVSASMCMKYAHSSYNPNSPVRLVECFCCILVSKLCQHDPSTQTDLSLALPTIIWQMRAM